MAKIKLPDEEITRRAKKYNLAKHIRIAKRVMDTIDKKQGVYRKVRKRAKQLEKEGGA